MRIFSCQQMVQPHFNCCIVFHIQMYHVPYFKTWPTSGHLHFDKLPKYGNFAFIHFKNFNFCHHVDKAHFLILSPITCVSVGRELWLWDQPEVRRIGGLRVLGSLGRDVGNAGQDIWGGVWEQGGAGRPPGYRPALTESALPLSSPHHSSQLSHVYNPAGACYFTERHIPEQGLRGPLVWPLSLHP